MKGPDLAAVLNLAADDLGSIEQHLHALATERRLPRMAIVMCTARYEEAAPALRDVLERAADGAFLSEDEEMLLFRGLHVQGGARDKQAYPALLRLLRRPMAEIDRLLGDATTETLSRIVCGVFDGDADPLFALIAGRKVNEFVRKSLFDAAAFLTWDGSIPAERTHGLLRRFYDERLAENANHAWIGWLEAIASLGLRDLAPLVYRAWEEGRVEKGFLDRSDFESDLVEAEGAPGDPARFQRARLGYVEDVVELLEWTDRPDQDRAETDRLATWPAWPEPASNPWRDVGRNDPCPCGSGKKAKRCHLS
jgi:hypothetical protein